MMEKKREREKARMQFSHEKISSYAEKPWDKPCSKALHQKEGHCVDTSLIKRLERKTSTLVMKRCFHR